MADTMLDVDWINVVSMHWMDRANRDVYLGQTAIVRPLRSLSSVFESLAGRQARLLGNGSQLADRTVRRNPIGRFLGTGVRQTVCEAKSFVLVGLEGNLLCEHSVACNGQIFRRKAPSADRLLTAAFELLDVSLNAVLNAVDSSAIATDHVEISMFFVGI